MSDQGRSIPRDLALTIRVVAALVLLAAVYAGILVVGAVMAPEVLLPGAVLLAALTGLHWAVRPMMLRRAGVVEVTGRAAAPELCTAVERLCALADLSPPRIMIAEVAVPNAFVVGRALCVTRGLVERLTAEELEAIVAHELGHLRHRDGLIVEFAAALAPTYLLPDDTDTADDSGGRWRRLGDRVVLVFAGWPLLVLFGWIPLLGRLLTLLVSRTRESAADRFAALLTGNPSTLASALVKTSAGIAETPSRDLRSVRSCAALLCLEIPSERLGLSRLIPAHPPLNRRLDRLARMSARLGTDRP